MNKHTFPTPAAVVLGMAILLSACGGSDAPTASSASPGASVAPSPAGSPSGSPAASPKGSVTLSTTELTLAPGAKQKLTVFTTDTNGKKTALDAKAGVAFKSSAPGDVSVAEDGTVAAAAKAKAGAAVTVTAAYKGASASCAVTVKAKSTGTGGEAKAVVANVDDIQVIVNKQRYLPDTYKPNDLVEPNVRFSFTEKNERRFMRKEAAAALEKLFAGADNDGVKLYAVSGFRSYATQKSLYENNVRTKGEKEASRFSARPGTSEHQTGLAMDVSAADAKTRLEQSFESTEEGKWLAAHASEYGFVIRYQKGKEDITGYAYEPWHIRYVGVDIAKEVSAKGQTLEQYFNTDTVPVAG